MAAQRLIGSAFAGYAATLVMEQASSWLYQRQDERARERENQLRSEMPTSVLVRKAVRLSGSEPGDARVEKIGMLVHYVFGAGGGPAAKLLMRHGVTPLRAGLGVGAAMSVLADELANTLLGLTPPPNAFPWQAHARGAAAHAVYGLSLGLVLSAGAEDRP